MLKRISTRIFQSAKQEICRTKLTCVRFQSTDYSAKCEGLVIEPKDQVLWVRFNLPNKFNAISKEMYIQMTDTFTQVNKDETIKAIVLTGNGDYYSSGNDLNNFIRAMKDKDGFRAGLMKSKDILCRFVDSLINLEKFLIAAVNGPAVGIAVTTLPLCDYIIACDKATFQTPFTALGMCPEACSSFTIPQIMGQTRANELLLLNMTWDAKKAQNYGLVSDVVEHDKFYAHLNGLLYGKRGLVNSCYSNSLKISKSLVRDAQIKQKLMEVNRKECDEIVELWYGEECADALQKFFKRPKS